MKNIQSPHEFKLHAIGIYYCFKHWDFRPGGAFHTQALCDYCIIIKVNFIVILAE